MKVGLDELRLLHVHPLEVGVPEVGLRDLGFEQIGSDKLSSFGTGSGYVQSGQIGSGEGHAIQDRISHHGAHEGALVKTRGAKIGAGEIGARKVGAIEDRTGEVDSRQLDPRHRAPSEVGPSERRVGQHGIDPRRALHFESGEQNSRAECVVEHRFFADDAVKLGSREIGAPENGSPQLRPRQCSLTQVHSRQIRAAQVGPDQIGNRSRVRGLPLPPVAGKNQLQVFLICHRRWSPMLRHRTIEPHRAFQHRFE